MIEARLIRHGSLAAMVGMAAIAGWMLRGTFPEGVATADPESPAIWSASGSVVADVAVMTAPADGVLDGIFFASGDWVAAGDRVAEINSRARQYRLEAARSQIALYQDERARKRTQLQAIDERLSSLKLASAGPMATPQRISDEAAAASDIRRILASLGDQRASLAAAIAAGDSAITALEQAVASDLHDQSQHSVVAPLAGLVAPLVATDHPGVTAGQPLFRIVDPDSIRLQVAVNAREGDRVRVGDEVLIRFDRMPDDLFPGVVVDTGTGAPDDLRKRAVIRIAEFPEPALLPGLTGTAFFRPADMAWPEVVH